jgi:CBS-domain-containing membrane protein
MRDHSVGSLLVMSYSNPSQLAGIFTERDLLKWIDEVQHGGHWDKPVAHLMSKPVATISVTELDRAAELMIQGHFRHLPVTTSDGGVTKILGVISMRDLLAELVSVRSRRQAAPEVLKVPATFLATDYSGDEIRKLLTLGGKLDVRRSNFTDAVKPQTVASARLLLLDLDGVAAKIWAAFLQKLNQMDTHPPTIVFFDPRMHDDAHVELLRKLSRPGALEVFAKPLNVIGFLARIRELAGA